MNDYYINSIYFATEGEGIHIGTPQVFVRYQGCRLACRNCDSKDTWSFKRGGINLSLDKIISEVERLAPKVRRVSITGGDPLDQVHISGLIQLIQKLKTQKFYVNLEAAGDKIDDRVFDLLDFISFDFKTPSTGVETPIENILKLAAQYEGKFQIKSVIESEADFQYVMEAYQAVSARIAHKHFDWCLTPAFNTKEDFPQNRFQMVVELNQSAGGCFRVIGQQHKWIYGPTRKDV